MLSGLKSYGKSIQANISKHHLPHGALPSISSSDPFSGQACETKFSLLIFKHSGDPREPDTGARSSLYQLPQAFWVPKTAQAPEIEEVMKMAGFRHLRHSRSPRRGKPQLFNKPNPLGGVLDRGKGLRTPPKKRGE